MQRTVDADGILRGPYQPDATPAPSDCADAKRARPTYRRAPSPYLPHTVASLCSTLAAILHISSLEFHSPTGNDPSEPCTIANPEVLHTIANLLGLLDNPASAQTNLSKLTEALTFKTAYIDNEKCTVVLDLEKALEYKEVVAKSLYRLVWEWLGEFVNQKLSKEDFAGE